MVTPLRGSGSGAAVRSVRISGSGPGAGGWASSTEMDDTIPS